MTWFVVDGMDGSGKSTVGHLIEEKMVAQGRKVLFLEHPNDSCRSGRLAHKYLLKDGKFAMILSTTFYIFNVIHSLRFKRKHRKEYDDVIFVRYNMAVAYLPKCLIRSGYKVISFIFPKPDVSIFVDIDPVTFNINANQIEAKVTETTKAILPVHLYGQCADMDVIRSVAKKHGLFIIEDGAQAIGAKYQGEQAGTMGTVGCFSFFPSKNLGGAGDGGLVTTNDDEVFEKLEKMRVHGMHPKYYHKYIGGNFRLDALQAVVLSVKLPHLNDWHEGRRKNAAFYSKAFENCKNIITPKEMAGNYMIFNQYIVRVPKRDEVIAGLKAAGIGCDIYYPVSLHMQECFKYLGYKQGAFPEAEKAASETLALPIYAELTTEQKQYVADTLISLVEK